MRKPEQIERLYLDFDGFFASVHQALHPTLRGRPIGVVPFAGSNRTCVIAVSREAKVLGLKNVMAVEEAREKCPDLILVPQNPDLYRRAHNYLVSEIMAVLPIDAIKSIDEMTCRVEPAHRDEPELLGIRIKRRLHDNVGPWITSSIGIAANRQLAKMACKAGKWRGEQYGDGLTVWRPEDMPAPLRLIKIEDVPGIGESMARRLAGMGIVTIPGLLKLAPKQMRAIWNNVTGERLWYALNGYDIQTPPSGRGMYGHGRVLPPESRSLDRAHEASRLLLTKAARRMRREGWNAGRLLLWLKMREGGWARDVPLPAVRDDQAVLSALEMLWRTACLALPRRAWIIQVHVTLMDLTRADERQLDMLIDDEPARKRWEAVTDAIDALNAKYGRTLVSVGPWNPPGDFAGGKISYTRIPAAEDFW